EQKRAWRHRIKSGEVVRMCSFGGGRNRSARIAGIVLMVLGLLILLFSIPSWMWVSVLGILLISIGFLVWRFS
ncbi:MAG: hypothetical protein IKW66_06960, partial [Clostridia bacterium]|nr:hypothetical protein [Clostridia bacterium]